MFHLDFPKFTALDFSIGVFDFQNEIVLEPTHVTASVVGGQQYSRPGHSDIYHGRARQRGCFPRKLPQQPSEQSHRLLS